MSSHRLPQILQYLEHETLQLFKQIVDSPSLIIKQLLTAIMYINTCYSHIRVNLTVTKGTSAVNQTICP